MADPQPQKCKAKKDAEALADEFQRLVMVRTGLKGSDLVCPREKSDMTPCLARDGHLVVIEGRYSSSWTQPLCVGCEYGLLTLLAEERTKVVGG